MAGEHQPKVDRITWTLTTIGLALVLVTVVSFIASLFGFLDRTATRGEPMTALPVAVAAAPTAATPAPSAPAAAAAPAVSAPAAAPVATAAATSTSPAGGDAAAGATKYASCAACHGAQGQGGGMFPKLVGLSADQASDLLRKYRAGEQVGAQTALMAPNAANLSDADIADLAAHIASFAAAAPTVAAAGAEAAPAAPAAAAPAAVDEALLARGQAVYSQCYICHGHADDPQARMLNAPRMAGHPAAAVKSLMALYKEGKSVGPNSSYMWPIARYLSDEEIEAVAAYIGSVAP